MFWGRRGLEPGGGGGGEDTETKTVCQTAKCCKIQKINHLHNVDLAVKSTFRTLLIISDKESKSERYFFRGAGWGGGGGGG